MQITVTNLRKIFTEQGIKGASKWKREDFDSATIAAEFAAYAEAVERRIAAENAAVNAEVEAGNSTTAPRRGICTDCGRKEGFRGSELCTECREYAEWENTHSDNGHEDGKGEFAESCPVCHPELDPRTARRATATGRSRAGMVIVAKGTEIHKSETFKTAAEAKGWTVEMQRATYELPEGTTGEGTRYYANAIKAGNAIMLAWDGRAYDYPASSARIAGKDRKVRNLKEALRLL